MRVRSATRTPIFQGDIRLRERLEEARRAGLMAREAPMPGIRRFHDYLLCLPPLAIDASGRVTHHEHLCRLPGFAA